MIATKVSWKEKEAAVHILERDGRVDPLELIEAARNPEHPCHGDFTWDLEEAAAERWRDQARSLIRACKFEVLVEDIGVPVVRYVPSHDGDAVFTSLPRMRSKSEVADLVLAEVDMLLGVASRVYGICLSKQGIVGATVVAKLKVVQSHIAAVKSAIEE